MIKTETVTTTITYWIDGDWKIPLNNLRYALDMLQRTYAVYEDPCGEAVLYYLEHLGIGKTIEGDYGFFLSISKNDASQEKINRFNSSLEWTPEKLSAEELKEIFKEIDERVLLLKMQKEEAEAKQKEEKRKQRDLRQLARLKLKYESND
jgi:hypothetical protein